ncbi:MAG: amidohydrolase [Armatimonadetes bacterium]|nr:amidohydrolase [Armatimonadota bacterium]
MLLVRGGRVFRSIHGQLEEANILIEGERIMDVGPNVAAPADAQELDARGHVVIPGLINAHTHANNNLTKTMGDNWTLEDLRNHGPALYANRTAEEQYLSAAIGAVEMLKTGCTASYDQFAALPAPSAEGVEAVVRAYIDVGLRAVVAPAVADEVFYRAVPGLLDLLPPDLRATVERINAAPTEGLLRLTEEAIRRWDGAAGGRIRLAAAPVIPGECSDTFMQGCVRLVREFGVGLHTHLAETKVQAVSSLRRWGKTLVEHLYDQGLLGPHFVGGHGVWLTDDDIRRMADSGAMITHNPASNLKLGSGIAPIREMFDQGVTVGLGSDGSMSSDNQNMFEAMRFAALVGKVRFPHQPERWIGAQAAWEMATTRAARVLGMADDIGAIAPGRKADLVLLRANSVFLRPMNNFLNALVYAETGADVDTVLVGGRVVLEHGRVLTVNEDALFAQAQEAAEQTRARNAANWALAERLAPYVTRACQSAVATAYPVNRYAGPIRSQS